MLEVGLLVKLPRRLIRKKVPYIGRTICAKGGGLQRASSK